MLSATIRAMTAGLQLGLDGVNLWDFVERALRNEAVRAGAPLNDGHKREAIATAEALRAMWTVMARRS